MMWNIEIWQKGKHQNTGFQRFELFCVFAICFCVTKVVAGFCVTNDSMTLLYYERNKFVYVIEQRWPTILKHPKNKKCSPSCFHILKSKVPWQVLSRHRTQCWPQWVQRLQKQWSCRKPLHATKTLTQSIKTQIQTEFRSTPVAD